ncbi:MAG: hypothetical protein AMS22_08425 [Thiotrichales bacterium SG8_50]|nr:MAG: hypothetical protein AMS22_08425 [Thiotrichales bacterium SG8_50]
MRHGNSRDITYLKDIDLKSYHYPWSLDEWMVVGSDETYHWCVAVLKAEPIGYAVWQDHPRAVELHRLAVKPSERNRGAGTSLMQYICDYARRNYYPRVEVTVPEINCLPGDPDDVSAWLLKQGFKAELPILREHVRRYGRLVDCFVFARSMVNEPSA